MEDTFTLEIMSPHEVVWQGNVIALMAVNVEGAFTILPDHARFMTIIEKVPITVVLPDTSEKVFTYHQAVLFFADNVAKIYTQAPLRV